MRWSAGFPIPALALCLALTACEAPIVPWDSYEPGTLRLSDAGFWEMVTTFSEPDGTFPYGNFLSNENDYQSIVPGLLDRVPPEGVYLGVAKLADRVRDSESQPMKPSALLLKPDDPLAGRSRATVNAESDTR
jgi:hypothetical protein